MSRFAAWMICSLGLCASAGAQAPATPPYVAEAQADLKLLFPKEKLLQGVVLKDYAKLNQTLQGATGYAAWTNSATRRRSSSGELRD